MTENNEMDRLLYKACKDNKQDLLCYGPDFGKIERETLAKVKSRQSNRAHRAWARAAAAVAALFVLANVVIFYVDIGPVKAYRAEMRGLIFNLVGGDSRNTPEEQIVKTADEVRGAGASVPFQIPFPHWLPDGCSFVRLDVTDGEVAMQYGFSGGELVIRVANMAAPVAAPGYEEKLLSGHGVTIRRDANGRATDCYYVDGQLLIRISGVIDEKTLSHLIAQMKP